MAPYVGAPEIKARRLVLAVEYHGQIGNPGLMDYPNRKRIKIWGTARYVEDDAALLDELVDPDYGAQPQRAVVFNVSAWDLNCPQHITPRYTVEDLSTVPSGGGVRDDPA